MPAGRRRVASTVTEFHEVAQNAIEGATATVRGSMDQVAMTGQGYEAGWPR